MYKTLISILITLFIVLGSVSADALTFLWDANSESYLDGYVLYSSPTSGGEYGTEEIVYLSDLTDPENPTVTIVKPEVRTYFVLTAFGTYDGEYVQSDYSEEISFDPDATYYENENGEVVITINPPQSFRMIGTAEAAL